MKKKNPELFSFKDKLNLAITLLVVLSVSLLFAYINGKAILELLNIDPQIVFKKLRFTLVSLLITTGLWLILPIKIRIIIEAFLRSFGRVRSTFIFMHESSNDYTSISTKLTPTPITRLIGFILIAAGLLILFL